MTVTATTPEIKDQAAILLGHVAGYAGHRTIGIGLRSGLIRTLADAPAGATAGDLAARTGHDPFYVGVWCRSALAGGVCERDGDIYRLAPHMASLLLDEDSPAYAGGIFAVFEQHELFDRFEQVLGSGCGGTTAAPRGSTGCPSRVAPSTPGWCPEGSGGLRG